MVAFVLGNGISRRPIDIDLLKTLGDVYACNAVYRTHAVTALVATDRPIATEIQQSGYARANRFYTRRPEPNSGALRVPQEYFGYSSGPIAVAIACLDQHTRLYLLGFDLGPTEQGRFNNVFADTEHYKTMNSTPTFTGNWIKQIRKIAGDFPSIELIRVKGASTADVPDFSNMHNLQHMPMDEFVRRINTPKDL
jgi:hypothetical protein